MAKMFMIFLFRRGCVWLKMSLLSVCSFLDRGSKTTGSLKGILVKIQPSPFHLFPSEFISCLRKSLDTNCVPSLVLGIGREGCLTMRDSPSGLEHMWNSTFIIILMMLEMMDRRKMMMVLIHVSHGTVTKHIYFHYLISYSKLSKNTNFRDEQTEVITVRSDKEEVAELDSTFFLLAPRVPLFPRYHDFLQVAT